jgi:hypothetical protein
VATLALLGTACQPAPTPQMVLTFDVQPSGTYGILEQVVALKVRVSCTRPHRVGVTASVGSPNWRYLYPVDPYLEGVPVIVINCLGPAGSTFTTKWKWDTTAPTGVIPVRMTGNTEEFPDSIPAADLAFTADEEGVTFTHVFTWPGPRG